MINIFDTKNTFSFFSISILWICFVIFFKKSVKVQLIYKLSILLSIIENTSYWWSRLCWFGWYFFCYVVCSVVCSFVFVCFRVFRTFVLFFGLPDLCVFFSFWAVWGPQSGGPQSRATRFGPGDPLTCSEELYRTLNCTSCLGKHLNTRKNKNKTANTS